MRAVTKCFYAFYLAPCLVGRRGVGKVAVCPGIGSQPIPSLDNQANLLATAGQHA